MLFSDMIDLERFDMLVLPFRRRSFIYALALSLIGWKGMI